MRVLEEAGRWVDCKWYDSGDAYCSRHADDTSDGNNLRMLMMMVLMMMMMMMMIMKMVMHDYDDDDDDGYLTAISYSDCNCV